MEKKSNRNRKAYMSTCYDFITYLVKLIRIKGEKLWTALSIFSVLKGGRTVYHCAYLEPFCMIFCFTGRIQKHMVCGRATKIIKGKKLK